MFALLANELCVTKGLCTPASEPAKDATSFAIHSSTHGVYTAEQVVQYRNCSNDFQTQFRSAWDGNPWSGKGVKGYSPIGGNGKIEAFRVCWEPLKIQYPSSTSS